MKIGADRDVWRIATHTEYFTALGFRMHPSEDSSLPVSKLAATVATLRPSQAKTLAGNAMHLVTQSAWMLYIMSNIVQVSDVAPVPSMFKACSWEALENEDGDQADE